MFLTSEFCLSSPEAPNIWTRVKDNAEISQSLQAISMLLNLGILLEKMDTYILHLMGQLPFWSPLTGPWSSDILVLYKLCTKGMNLDDVPSPPSRSSRKVLLGRRNPLSVLWYSSE